MTVPTTKKDKDILVNTVCSDIAIGKSLKSISDEKHLTYSWLWGLLNSEENKDKYTRAREEQADKYAQEIIDIADNSVDPQKARVQIDARKWIACKMLPKLYGDKVDVNQTLKGGEDVGVHGLSFLNEFLNEVKKGRIKGNNKAIDQE